jgi:general secretion pathway protein K
VGLLLVLTLITSSLILASRSQVRALMANTTQTELSALADGLVQVVALRLSEQMANQSPDRRVAIDGTPLSCRDGGSLVSVQVFDTAGLADLNFAQPALLTQLLQDAGASSDDAAAIAASIVAFRTPLSAVQGDGGSASDAYRQLERPFGPKGGQFERVDELDQVAGMTQALFERLRPLLTVHSRTAAIDTRVAPLELRRALGGDSASLGDTPFTGGTAVSRGGTRASRNRQMVFVIRADVVGSALARTTREAVVELTRSSPTGFVVRDWTRLPSPAGHTRASPDTASCDRLLY